LLWQGCVQRVVTPEVNAHLADLLRERGFDFAFASLIFDGATVEVEDRRPPRHPANHLGTKEQST